MIYLYKKLFIRDFYDKSKKKKEVGDEGYCFFLMKWMIRVFIEIMEKLGFFLWFGLG